MLEGVKVPSKEEIKEVRGKKGGKREKRGGKKGGKRQKKVEESRESTLAEDANEIL